MSRRRIWGVRSLVFSISFLAIHSTAHAADKFWGAPFGGTFNDAINWQGGSVADMNDVAHFGLTTNPILLQRIYTVDFSDTVTNQALKIEDDFVTFNMNARTYSATLATGTEIGNQAGRTGRLTITDGTVTFGSAASVVPIGSVTNSNGVLTVTTGGIFSGVNLLLVGLAGSGTLTVNNGGLVQTTFSTIIGDSPGVTGAATVTGVASTLNSAGLDVGNLGTGTLNIAAGGTVQTLDSGNSANVGVSGGSGTVSVDGVNSRWNNAGELGLGHSGFGALNISAGGRVQDATAVVGKNASGIGTASVEGAGSQWVNTGGLTVGDKGQGTLSIISGGRVQDTTGSVGVGFGSNGLVTVSGTNSKWISSDQLIIGNLGSGTLRIENGGSVTSNSLAFLGADGSGSGIVTITGTGSTWTNGGNFSVGEFGTGMLTIEAGGALSNAFANMAVNPTAFGTALVTGSGSTWTSSGHLDVGFIGTGTLTIEAGAIVTSAGGGTALNITSSRGTVVVSGAGSKWIDTQDMLVGNSGVGSMRIESGGNVSNTIAWIGTNAGARGTAIVTGAGSTWTNSDSLSVGSRGNGTLSIEAGGAASSVNAFIGEFTGSNGTATLTGAGSTWTISGRLSIGGRADTLQNGGIGTLNIQPGGTVNISQDVVLFPNGVLKLQGGTLDTSAVSFQGGGQFQWTSGTFHVATYNGNLLNQGGTLAPGHSAGSTTINGSYTQLGAGAMEIEIGGTTMGAQYDFINVTGSAQVDGDLELKLINGFIPMASQTFVVFDAASLLGAFDNAANGQRMATSDGGASFVVHYGAGSTFDPTQIVLSDFLAVALPGDYNNNGAVDAADYVVWRKNNGTTTSLPNDPIGGTIGQAHYDNWRAHFGQIAGSGSDATANAAVPEPATAVLMMFAAVSWCLRRGWAT